MNQSAQALDEAVSNALANRLGQKGKIAAAYLLGSAADGRLRADSDVDIALLPLRGVEISGMERADLAADLELVLGRPVDVGVLHTGNLVYAKEAVALGKLLFEGDRASRVRFVTLVYSMYADLQENRQEVIRGYAA